MSDIGDRGAVNGRPGRALQHRRVGARHGDEDQQDSQEESPQRGPIGTEARALMPALGAGPARAVEPPSGISLSSLAADRHRPPAGHARAGRCVAGRGVGAGLLLTALIGDVSLAAGHSCACLRHLTSSFQRGRAGPGRHNLTKRRSSGRLRPRRPGTDRTGVTARRSYQRDQTSTGGGATGTSQFGRKFATRARKQGLLVTHGGTTRCPRPWPRTWRPRWRRCR
jgi:hypothetical protein